MTPYHASTATNNKMLVYFFFPAFPLGIGLSFGDFFLHGYSNK